MPRELVAVAPRTPALREYAEPELSGRQVRIRSELASPKHGTELVGYRAEPAADRGYDPYWGCVAPATGEVARGGAGGRFPRRLGNMCVGVVTDTGPEAARFEVGQRVFGHLPIRETHTVDETAVDPLPAGLPAAAAVCLDPAVMALGVRDAGIGLGDHVAVFGLGAIGLMAAQLAHLAGADRVVGVDPIPDRRRAAELLVPGVLTVDPAGHGGDAGFAVRAATGRTADDRPPPPPRHRVLGGYTEVPTEYGRRGVDVAVEASGSAPVLHQAIRATRFGGTICLLSFYGTDAAGVRLGDEFHVNRQRIVSARVESLPLRDGPAWTLERLSRLALGWIRSGRLRTEGIVSPVVPFDECDRAYREIDHHPERSIKLGITFP